MTIARPGLDLSEFRFNIRQINQDNIILSDSDGKF